MNINDLLISEKKTVKDAMSQIDNTAYQVLFIVDENNKLLFSLSDGDVRRYLLAGGKLSGRVSDAGHPNPKCATDLDGAKALYNPRYCFAIPIVDGDGRIVDIYYLEDEEEKTTPKLGIPVVINAGGKGSRLDPYTRVLPKPLIPVGDIPIIELIMKEYVRFGCTEFHMIVNYKKQLIKTYFSECDNSYNLKFYDEDKPLGTGGGLCYLKGKLGRTFFFSNCDNLLRTDYESIIRFHKEKNNRITMVCAYKNLTIPYGVIEMGESGKIIDMKEKPEMSFLTNTGIYVVEPEVLDDIGDGECIGFPDVVIREQNKGFNTAVYPVSESQWMDMGQIAELEKMRKRLYGENNEII